MNKKIITIIALIILLLFLGTTTNAQEALPLKRGDNNNQIREVKLDLSKIGFSVSSNPNTLFGPATERTVKEFQDYYNLEITGAIDKKTYWRIEEILSSPFQKGSTDKRVISLKHDLEVLGFKVSNKPNQSFGPKTQKRVKEFQTFYDLVTNGIADDITLDKIDNLIRIPMQRGSYRKDVIIMKQKLAKLGFIVSSNPTGAYGPKTERIVKEFQEYYELERTGVADEETLTMIENVLSDSFRRGQNDANLIQIKQNLSKLGFIVSSNPTGAYGPKTERIVKEFQRYYGLKETGVIEQRTLSYLEDTLFNSLRRGLDQPEVIILKEKLSKLGFEVSPNPTEQFGPKTERTVREFQKYYGLKDNGVVDDATLNKIEELISTPMNRGSYRKDVIIMKQNLSKLGFIVSSNPTGAYGPKTELIVKEFQEYYELEKNGVADEETLTMIENVLSDSFRRGQNDANLIQIKQNLSKLGFIVSSNPTGAFGPKTERIVKEFQRYYGLKETGIIEQRTLSNLENTLLNSLRRGLEQPEVIILKEKLSKLGFEVSPIPTEQFGPKTERTVKALQEYYSLKKNGIIDGPTTTKIDKVLSSPLQKGRKHNKTIQLKKDLTRLGFGSFKYMNTSYGSLTEKAVKEFQNEYGLPVSGIAEERTLAKIKEAIDRSIIEENEYGITLEEALNIQMNQLQQTDKYRNKPAYISANYVDISRQATIYSTGNVRLRTSSDLSSDENIKYTVSNGTGITIIKEVNGDIFNGSKKWYEIEYNNHKDPLYVHSKLVKLDTKVATVTANLNVRADTNTNSHIFGQLTKGEEVTILNKGNNWHQINYKTWRNPTRSDVKSYLDPTNHDEFQHLKLSASVGVKADELNEILKGKGTLNGLGQAFINGGKKHGVNEIYLISHAFLESGNGTSALAKGVKVGINKNGNPERVTSENKKYLKEIKKVYNMFGIGAVDSNPLNGGAIRAYREDWTSPEKAIEGGAKFIGEKYIHRKEYKQNTLYKMRWNPAKPGVHQYATDIGWATKQVSTIKKLYNLLDNPILHFDIPKYK